MVDSSIFSARLRVCKACDNWRGVCLKGHALAADPGCPERKFEGADGADYLPDLPSVEPSLPSKATGCCGSATAPDIKPMSWVQVWEHLREATTAWAASGFELASSSAYVERLHKCKECPKGQYQWFQCRNCKCVVYVKAKLASEHCPLGFW